MIISYFNNFVHIICLVICLFIHSLHIYLCIYSYIYREILFCFEWMYLGTGYSLPCVYFLSLKKRSCISSKCWIFSVILCSFSVDLLWNNVAVFQFNVKVWLLTVSSLYSLFSRFIWPTDNVTFFVVLAWVGIPSRWVFSVLSLAYIYIGPYSFIMFRYFHLCTSIMIHWYAPLGCRWIMSRPSTTDCKWPAKCSGFITAVAIGRGDP